MDSLCNNFKVAMLSFRYFLHNFFYYLLCAFVKLDEYKKNILRICFWITKEKCQPSSLQNVVAMPTPAPEKFSNTSSQASCQTYESDTGHGTQ